MSKGKYAVVLQDNNLKDVGIYKTYNDLDSAKKDLQNIRLPRSYKGAKIVRM